MQRFALFAPALFLALWCWSGSVAAKGDNGMYSVHGISVDVTAENASAAREKAVAQGARKGLEQLLKNLTLPDAAKSLPVVTEKMAEPLVQDFEVESERASSVRYIARLGIRFRPDGVRALLAGAGVHFVSSRAPPVLVIPIYRAASGDLLWQSNPWRQAWQDNSSRAALVPVVVPEGTPDDIQNFTAADVGNPDKLQALADRYKTETVVIAVATAVSAKGDPGEGLKIMLSAGGPDVDLRSPGAPNPAQALASGVATVMDQLDTIWKQRVLQGTSGAIAFKSAPQPEDAGETADAVPSGNSFALRAVLSGPGDWSQLRAKLSQAGGIKRVDLKSLERDQAIVVVTIAGDEDKLAQILASAGLSLGAPAAVPADDSQLASMVPAAGPGAGMIYPINSGTP